MAGSHQRYPAGRYETIALIFLTWFDDRGWFGIGKSLRRPSAETTIIDRRTPLSPFAGFGCHPKTRRSSGHDGRQWGLIQTCWLQIGPASSCRSVTDLILVETMVFLSRRTRTFESKPIQMSARSETFQGPKKKASRYRKAGAQARRNDAYRFSHRWP